MSRVLAATAGKMRLDASKAAISATQQNDIAGIGACRSLFTMFSLAKVGNPEDPMLAAFVKFAINHSAPRPLPIY